MQARPEIAFRCGAFALHSIKLAIAKQRSLWRKQCSGDVPDRTRRQADVVLCADAAT
jgi:hypothetical protein